MTMNGAVLPVLAGYVVAAEEHTVFDEQQAHMVGGVARCVDHQQGMHRVRYEIAL
jgi:methylmalonyl-CoA mutase N-terminal domain/subunit